MSKFIKSILCIMATCTLVFVGCSNKTNKDEVQSSTDEKVVNSSESTANSSSNEEVTNSSEKDENTLSKDDASSESTKQIYLEKLNKLQDDLSESLKEKYNGSTYEMLEAASEEYEKWDNMINEVYSKIMEELTEEEKSKLIEEQLNWIKVRDDKAEAAANEFKGGTLESLNKVMSLAESTRERCYELVNQYMKESMLSTNDTTINDGISEKVKDYIIYGQEDKPEVTKLKWSTTFLNEVNIKGLYDEYINNGGNSDDIEEFAKYITLNAPILSNWEELFKKDLYDIYGENVVKIEHIEGDLYQAYVEKDGKEVPYVAVSARTGYFHG